jgi:nodulation protein E
MNPVVITGLGCISALGHNVAANWAALRRGDCAIGPHRVTSPDLWQFPINTKITAQVRDYQPADYLSPEQIAALDRFAQFALIAAQEAVHDAGLSFSAGANERCAVILGSGIGGIESMHDGFQRLYVKGINRVHPLTIPRVMLNSAVSAISLQFAIRGPCFSVSSACSSSNHAIAQAFALIRSGMADVAISGGSEACLVPGLIKSWEALRVLAPDTCRPFSHDRKGLVLGEGAGVLVLESATHAERRGAHIYAELAGCGMSADAHDLLQPDVNGAARAMRQALRDGALVPEQIGYINAHGTGTISNDITETRAIHQVFGEHAGKLAVSSSKSMHGHALGAAGGLEAVATVKALAEGIIPPTANFTEADSQCDLDYVPNQAREKHIEAALSNSFAFGGLNAVIAVKHWH